MQQYQASQGSPLRELNFAAQSVRFSTPTYIFPTDKMMDQMILTGPEPDGRTLMERLGRGFEGCRDNPYLAEEHGADMKLFKQFYTNTGLALQTLESQKGPNPIQQGILHAVAPILTTHVAREGNMCPWAIETSLQLSRLDPTMFPTEFTQQITLLHPSIIQMLAVRPDMAEAVANGRIAFEFINPNQAPIALLEQMLAETDVALLATRTALEGAETVSTVTALTTVAGSLLAGLTLGEPIPSGIGFFLTAVGSTGFFLNSRKASAMRYAYSLALMAREGISTDLAEAKKNDRL